MRTPLLHETLREWNITHQRAGAIKYVQARLDISDEMDVRQDRERYEADRAKDLRLSRAQGLDAALANNRLDALLFPGNSGSDIAARSGYPSIAVPFARLAVTAPANNPFPAGFDPRPVPFGVQILTAQCADAKMIALAYAFEHATKRRVPPPAFP